MNTDVNCEACEQSTVAVAPKALAIVVAISVIRVSSCLRTSGLKA